MDEKPKQMKHIQLTDLRPPLKITTTPKTGSPSCGRHSESHRELVIDLAPVGDDLLGDGAEGLHVHLQTLQLGVGVTQRLRVLPGHA